MSVFDALSVLKDDELASFLMILCKAKLVFAIMEDDTRVAVDPKLWIKLADVYLKYVALCEEYKEPIYPDRLTRQELIEEIAEAAGGLDIALNHMKPEALPEEVLETWKSLCSIVDAESDKPILVSGAGVLGGKFGT